VELNDGAVVVKDKRPHSRACNEATRQRRLGLIVSEATATLEFCEAFMSQKKELTGPDFSKGIPLKDIPEGGNLIGHAGEEEVL
jgi:hypothetical protein